MRSWEVQTSGGYFRVRESRPPFMTTYERDLYTWQRRQRMIATTVTLLTLSGVAAVMLRLVL